MSDCAESPIKAFPGEPGPGGSKSALELLAMGAGIYLMYLVLVLEAYLDG